MARTRIPKVRVPKVVSPQATPPSMRPPSIRLPKPPPVYQPRIYGTRSAEPTPPPPPPPSGDVYVVGNAGSGSGSTKNVWKLDPDGNLLWSHLLGHNATMLSVAVDAGGMVYVAGQRTGSPKGSVWKLDPTQQEPVLWSYDTGAGTAAITVDSAGNVYVVGVRANNATVWKLNASGVPVWTFDTGSTGGYSIWSGTPDVCVDADGNVYVGAKQANNKNIWKLSSAGAELWSYQTAPLPMGAIVTGVVLDASGMLYATGNSGPMPTFVDVWKLDPADTPSEVWTYATGEQYTMGVAYDGQSSHIYVISEALDIPENIWKLTLAGQMVWEAGISGGGLYGVAVDADGTVGAVGTRAAGQSVWKIDPGQESPTELWSYDTGATALGIAIKEY